MSHARKDVGSPTPETSDHHDEEPHERDEDHQLHGFIVADE
jgi:hypothetical protein